MWRELGGILTAEPTEMCSQNVGEELVPERNGKLLFGNTLVYFGLVSTSRSKTAVVKSSSSNAVQQQASIHRSIATVRYLAKDFQIATLDNIITCFPNIVQP